MKPGNLITKLTRLEERLQNLIEGSAGRLFPSTRVDNNLSYVMVKAIRELIEDQSRDFQSIPNMFILRVHPTIAAEVETNSSQMDVLVEILVQAANDVGVNFSNPPLVRVLPDQELNPGEINAQAMYSLSSISETLDYVIKNGDTGQFEIPAGAFLIVDGSATFTLGEKLVNIGRREDNHLVIDDKRVSRIHAQLRTVEGRYTIFDLGSTGGTFVNGKRIQKCALQPGDVISLAGVLLIYGQESMYMGETQAYSPEMDQTNKSLQPDNKKVL